ncbi:MAG: cytochrome c nitrite reductase small subunit [Deltaproteobacteria bacterium]|nr:cytochrome c nitrite reductase small subunit [Deltaproteobacteria bacterium]
MLRLIRQTISMFMPPPQWRWPVLMAVAVLGGLGVFVVYISNAVSYLSDDPKTCINCHIMTPQYVNWTHSSHARFATCNDCHVPQDNLLNHYFFKAKDGMRHSFMFTFRLEPQTIRIKEGGIEVVQQNCLRCHQNLLSETSLVHQDNKRLCWECHRELPHGRVNGLSATPMARVPLLPSVAPDWLKEFIDNDSVNK